ncbi:hypothetical protein Godav_020054, partial [Gossypium davidsonii]|nr:hypothetical protein [Gossypium davidsonii]
MKRQGSNIEAMAQAAGKHQVRKKSRRGLDADEGEVALCSMQSTSVWWEEWAYVDEQMSWASIWSPFWDVDFVDMAYGALFNDVAWDDDIWDLKNVMEREIYNFIMADVKASMKLFKTSNIDKVEVKVELMAKVEVE